MRVGIDATCISNRPSGARRRFEGLYGALFELLYMVDFVVFIAKDSTLDESFEPHRNVLFKRVYFKSQRRAWRFIQSYFYFKKLSRSEDFDLFEYMHLPSLNYFRSASLLTVHDIREAYVKSAIRRFIYIWILGYSLRKVSEVITVSWQIRSELLSYHPEASVSVVYNGTDCRNAFEASDQELIRRFKKKYNLPLNFFLAVGHFEERKNYHRLILAFQEVVFQREIDIYLVIVGNDSGELTSIRNLVSDFNMESRVTILENLSSHDLSLMYFCSQGLIFVSLYEGFGIPLIEAMSFGKPCVLSDLPVFREIVQDNAIFVDAFCSQSIADGIQEFLSAPDKLVSISHYSVSRSADFRYGLLARHLAIVYSRYLPLD